jgi:hypothetical protein
MSLIQVPILQQLLLNPLPRQSLPIVGLDVYVAATIEVAEVATDAFEILPSPAKHLDHDLRSAAHRATDQLDFALR